MQNTKVGFADYKVGFRVVLFRAKGKESFGDASRNMAADPEPSILNPKA